MKVALLGAGSVALGMASYLHAHGHSPVLWSPSGASTAVFTEGQALTAHGRVETVFVPQVAGSCVEALREAEVAILAVPGYAHRAVLDAAAPHLRADQTIIISSHCSLSALYLSKLLARRRVRPLIVAWATTVTTGRRKAPLEVHVSSIRNELDVATIPASAQQVGLEICRKLFGDRFRPRDDVLAITLSNLNPPIHVAQALCNFTRIECAEEWPTFYYVTKSVGHLVETLDLERLALARAFNLSVRTVHEHYHLSFGVPFGSVSEMAMAVHTGRGSPSGPKSTDTRFITEDVPFGLVPLAMIARAAGVALPLHEAAIALMSGLRKHDFRGDNDLIDRLGLAELAPEELHACIRNGWPK